MFRNEKIIKLNVKSRANFANVNAPLSLSHPDVSNEEKKD
jgi:hypothetical protein